MAFAMLWQLFWGLSPGFLFSAAVEVMVSRAELSKLLPDASPRSIAWASLLGAASSSCSYAAVAMARSMNGGHEATWPQDRVCWARIRVSIVDDVNSQQERTTPALSPIKRRTFRCGRNRVVNRR
ncbi:permease [Paraburkholderia lycopersici]|uniref:permease n=1 Tax=Paraburkholderia lycopersici TaxID=416944 RepID=UPI000B161BFA|nr:permease [Paraburkholderia lycopersici]